MLRANSIAGFPSASRTLVSQGSSNQEDQDIWFDAIENHEASPTDAVVVFNSLSVPWGDAGSAEYFLPAFLKYFPAPRPVS
ncbi:MAG: hypothetical protein G5703_06920 [Serratia symbiotica]|nr:hypothetical protein [Serratia symbiotica]